MTKCLGNRFSRSWVISTDRLRTCCFGGVPFGCIHKIMPPEWRECHLRHDICFTRRFCYDKGRPCPVLQFDHYYFKFYQSSTPCSGDLSTLNKVVYKLLQVHKATTILQQLSAWCYLSGSRDSKSLNWSSLQSWLIAAVSLVPKLQCSTSPFCLFLKWFKNALGMSLETICQNMVLFLLCSASSYLCEPIFSKSKWPVNSGFTVVFLNAPRECWGYAISTNVV
jgi:hypothetical protein